MINLTFLSANKPLTKTYIFDEKGNVESQPYPLSSSFTSHEVIVETIEDFYVQLITQGQHGRCLLRGNLERPITRESRAGLTTQQAFNWMLLDFDGVDFKGRTIQDIMIELGIGDVDYIQQASASQGIKNGMNYHVFFLIDPVKTPQDIKNWVKWKNLSISLFKEQLNLTKSAMSLHWPIDVVVNSPDRLIYIAPPIILGADDVVEERIQLVKRDKRTAALGQPSATVDTDAVAVIKQLRSAAGLPEHNLGTKYVKTYKAHILQNPDIASVTGVKKNEEFTYLNLNSGDSWAYYHLTAFPDLLFNFKGEPVYKLEDICPDYYHTAKKYAKDYKLEVHRPENDQQITKYFIINHKEEGRYYKVTYNPEEGITLNPAPSHKHIADFCVMNRIVIPENIDDWSVEFNPIDKTIVNNDKKTLNLYKPTIYRKHPEVKTDVPEPYYKLIHHVCGSDDTATDRFINWLAFIWQTGKKPKTAWVLHGTFGTGKGRLLKILGELFGDHCVVVSPETVSEHFNALVEKAQILWIDEVTTDAWDNAKMTPKLRNWITEPTISIRGMRKESAIKPSYMGIIVAANEHNPVEIPKHDRRWNVAPRQETKLKDVAWATDDMLDDDNGWLYSKENLISLAAALSSYAVDDNLATKPLENEAKEIVMRTTQHLPEDIIQALQDGEVSFFLEHINNEQTIPSIEAAQYKEVVSKMMRGGRMALSTRDIMKIFDFLAGWRQSPGKFSKAVSKYGLHLAGKTAREGSRTFAGTYFVFNVSETDRAIWAQLEDTQLRVVREA